MPAEQQPALGDRGDLRNTAGATEHREAGGHLQCGACTAEAGKGLGRGGREGGSQRAGDEGGAPAPNPGITVRRRGSPRPGAGSPASGNPGARGDQKQFSALLPEERQKGRERAPKGASLRCRTPASASANLLQAALEPKVSPTQDRSGRVALKLTDGEVQSSPKLR